MRAALLALVLLPLLAAAQSWCPPGATWHFSFGGYLFEGYLQRTYVADTIVGGRNAQRLTDSGHQISTFNGYPVHSIVQRTHFTSLDGDLLLIWIGAAWDTLIRFDAVPGDRWFPPGIGNQPCGALPSGMYEVVDTSTVWLNGTALRSVTLDAVLAGGVLMGTPWFHFTERIGLHQGFRIDPWCLVDGGYEQIRCYSDSTISYQAPTWTAACDLGLAVEERLHDEVDAFPNPGSTHFTLELSPGPHTITLFDATGRVVLQQRTSDTRPVIATEALPDGLYSISVRDEQGGVMGATWVKE
ncbi:MAG: T9SS type A sorting domain-containing protein [Flavobacteriales bacterium]|nr:T9SS type A sorting domain-containing protein [Flavobacteriales bacterium]